MTYTPNQLPTDDDILANDPEAAAAFEERYAREEELREMRNESFLVFWDMLQSGNVTPQVDIADGYWDVE